MATVKTERSWALDGTIQVNGRGKWSALYRLSGELVAHHLKHGILSVRPKGVKKKMDMAASTGVASISRARRFPSWPGFTSSCSQPAWAVALTVGCGH